MSEQSPMEFSEEEMREQLERVRVQDLLVQTVVSIINLAAAKADDKEQLRLGIESARALLPLIEAELGPDAKSFRDALSQLQLEYAKGAPAASDSGATGPDQPEKAQGDDAAGPAQSSGKLWVPGQ